MVDDDDDDDRDLKDVGGVREEHEGKEEDDDESAFFSVFPQTLAIASTITNLHFASWFEFPRGSTSVDERLREEEHLTSFWSTGDAW